MQSTARSIYRPLDPRCNEIRVVTIARGAASGPIQCRLDHVSLDQLPHYEALSYVWGDPNNTVPISLNGHTFQATANLHAALAQLRTKGLGAIWIDAICINQQDVAEKNQQLLLMGSIYKRAAVVQIWLGGRSRSSTSAFAIMNHLQSAENPREEVKKMELKPLLSLLRRKYWQRMWIIQEVTLARDIVVTCGDQEIGWPAFTKAVRPALLHLKSAESMYPYLRYFNNIYDLRTTVARDDADQKVSLLDALLHSIIAEATDPRDKVFGLLGLVHDGDTYVPRPNYAEPLENLCLGMTLGYISGKRSLDAIILLGRGTTDRLASARTMSPSWIPRWHSLGEDKFLQHRLARLYSGGKSWKASGSSTCRATYDGDRLRCRGIYVGTIHTTGGCLGDDVASDRDTVVHHYDGIRNGLPNPYKSEKATFRAIFGTFRSLNRRTSSSTPTESSGYRRRISEGYMTEFLRIWRSDYRAGFSDEIQAWIEAHRGFYIHGRTIEQWARWKSRTVGGVQCRILAATQRKNSLLADVQRLIVPNLAHPIQCGHRLMLTDRGQVGWAHPGGKPGDCLYVLEGCSVPVILRPVSRDDFCLVGDSWVSGLMNGEALKQQEPTWTRVNLV